MGVSALTREQNFNLLLVRPDRIGDVVLSTPVIEALKRHYPGSTLTLMVRPELVPIVAGIPGVDAVMTFEPHGRHRGLEGLFLLIRELRAKRFRVGVVLSSHWKIAASLYAAGVRYRVGPFSKLHSFLFFNRGLRQRRSRVEMHEADYNLQLLRRLGVRIPRTRTYKTRVSIDDDSKRFGKEFWSVPGVESRRWIAVHPGMGGSALNWPTEHYAELIKLLLDEDYGVVITGSVMDRKNLEALKSELKELPTRGALRMYESKIGDPVSHLAAVFDYCSVVVAPSTGPLHIATALGKHVVTFYPPIRVQSAVRWGPYGEDEAASVLVPDVFCGQEFRCLGPNCNYYPCMKSLLPNVAADEVRKQLQLSNPKD